MLLVEDEPLAREMMRVALSQFGADVRAVASVDEALAALERGRVEVVITDIAMPGKDGFELLETIRRRDTARPDAGRRGLSHAPTSGTGS